MTKFDYGTSMLVYSSGDLSIPLTLLLQKLIEAQAIAPNVAEEIKAAFPQGEVVTKQQLISYLASEIATKDFVAAEIAKLDAKIAKLDAKIDKIAAELNAKIDTSVAELNAKIDTSVAELNAKIDVGFNKQKYGFIIIGLLIAITQHTEIKSFFLSIFSIFIK